MKKFNLDKFTPSQIKALRVSMKITQAKFGYLLFTKKSTVSMWERGERRPQGIILTYLKGMARDENSCRNLVKLLEKLRKMEAHIKELEK